MKTKLTLTLWSVWLMVPSAFAQILVNKFLLDPFGIPSTEIEWSASTTDEEGNLITLGHDVISPEEVAILLVQQSPDGNINWEVHYSVEGMISKNYGIALQTDAAGNIYAIGASISDPAEQLNYVILKYDSEGTLLWDETYNHNADLHDVPTALTVASDGAVFVTGGSYDNNTGLDATTLKVNGASGTIEWVGRYDLAGLDDAAVDIELDSDEHPVIVGGSEGSPDNWRFVSVKYDKNNGNELDQNAFTTPGISQSLQPVALQKDAMDNYYLAGNVNVGSSNQTVEVMKLDAALNLLWSRTIDHSESDGIYSLQLGTNDEVTLTGYTTINDQKQLLSLRYDTEGELLWETVRRAEKANFEVTGKRSVVDHLDNVYILGEVEQENKSRLLILKIDDSGTIVWEDTHFSYAGNGYERPGSISRKEEKIYVSARYQGPDFNRYYGLRIEEWDRQAQIIFDESTGETPLYKANNLIVKFSPSALQTERINQTGLRYGAPADFLHPTALGELEGIIPTDRITMIRIFRELKTTDTLSISRLAEWVRIPEFWSTFVLVFPDGTDLGAIIEDLTTVFPTVEYSHLNYIGRMLDPIEEPNDTWFGDQLSLSPNPLYSPAYNNANINIEEAWQLETGKPHIRVGVYDSPLDYKHRDFGFQNNDPSTSVVKNGWHFNTNTNLLTIDNTSFDAHGTQVAGVFGAITNNNLDVAGIAGGCYAPDSPGDNRGVSLYSLGMMNETFLGMDLEYVVDAIVTSALDEPTFNYGYGVHLANHSWGIDTFMVMNNSTEDDFYTPGNIAILRDAIHFSTRNQVTNVASRGNGHAFNNGGSDVLLYPACYDDPWTINTGGTGLNGVYKNNESGGNWAASYGSTIDVAAPAEHLLIETLYPEDEVGAFGGTSASAAHVTGLAGLILSYANTPNNNDYENLAPEDVEFIIQKTASHGNPNLPDYDIFTGFGKIDAGAALQFIDQEHFDILHFDSEGSSSSMSINLVESDVTLELAEPYLYTTPFYEPQPVVFQTPASYKVDVYKVTVAVAHTLPDDVDILHYWERHSSSHLLKAYDSTTMQLFPHERIEITSINQNVAQLEGYIYHLKDVLSGEPLGWLPFAATTTANRPKFAYSILIEKEPVSIADLEKAEKGWVEVMPNPASDQVSLVVQSSKNEKIFIECYNSLGQIIFTKQHFLNEDISNIRVDISGLSPGSYGFKVCTSNKWYSILFAKQ